MSRKWSREHSIRLPSQLPKRNRLPDLAVDERPRIGLVREAERLALVEELAERDSAGIGDDGFPAAGEGRSDRVRDERGVAMLVQHVRREHDVELAEVA